MQPSHWLSHNHSVFDLLLWKSLTNKQDPVMCVLLINDLIVISCTDNIQIFIMVVADADALSPQTGAKCGCFSLWESWPSSFCCASSCPLWSNTRLSRIYLPGDWIAELSGIFIFDWDQRVFIFCQFLTNTLERIFGSRCTIHYNCATGYPRRHTGVCPKKH